MKKDIYINSIGAFLPGNPISNHEIEDYLGRIHGKDSRLKNRILKNNGIQSRYYAIDKNQNSLLSNAAMASSAIADSLAKIGKTTSDIDFLSAASTQGDLPVPGFANMVHAELKCQPIEVASYNGVCISGMQALKGAYLQVKSGEKNLAISCASEFPSRLFKASRFEKQNQEQLSFDTEFLRFMLSDGAGAMTISDAPNLKGLSLKIEWISVNSYSGNHELCMYAGKNPDDERSWLDYPDFETAAAEGAINLKQDVRLLDEMVKLGVDRFFELIDQGKINPKNIDWLVCHYSSEFFKGQIKELLTKGGLEIEEEKWFSNLTTKGNTGAASIYIMLQEILYSGKLKAGDQILCMVPESGRFSTSFMSLTVVGENEGIKEKFEIREPASPEINIDKTDYSEFLVRQLTRVWIDFENQLNQVPIVRKIYDGDLTKADYLLLLEDLRQQVIDGSQWIARAGSNIAIEIFELRSAFLKHAGTEHKDYQILEKNYANMGGDLEKLRSGTKNIGSEALSAWMFNQASKPNPVDLLGAMFIIEGLGNRMAGYWGELIQKQLKLDNNQVDFFLYHGVADVDHFKGLEDALNHPEMNMEIAKRIVKTAKVTARLYAMQLLSLGDY
ncbi:StlD/DarB family beta-ketosynthase [Crocinitomix catalasitica]|uniref:StlD/DarB family beta-ketosynthase n=1 Tax=Crocinitomix catalasitica TaxID=184607 RepID=UPI000488833B|nr:StlD/DarB family beta-ketosynthase [Crocinitomix catalasitica]